ARCPGHDLRRDVRCRSHASHHGAVPLGAANAVAGKLLLNETELSGCPVFLPLDGKGRRQAITVEHAVGGAAVASVCNEDSHAVIGPRFSLGVNVQALGLLFGPCPRKPLRCNRRPIWEKPLMGFTFHRTSSASLTATAGRGVDVPR